MLDKTHFQMVQSFYAKYIGGVAVESASSDDRYLRNAVGNQRLSYGDFESRGRGNSGNSSYKALRSGTPLQLQEQSLAPSLWAKKRRRPCGV